MKKISSIFLVFMLISCKKYESPVATKEHRISYFSDRKNVYKILEGETLNFKSDGIRAEKFFWGPCTLELYTSNKYTIKGIDSDGKVVNVPYSKNLKLNPGSYRILDNILWYANGGGPKQDNIDYVHVLDEKFLLTLWHCCTDSHIMDWSLYITKACPKIFEIGTKAKGVNSLAILKQNFSLFDERFFELESFIDLSTNTSLKLTDKVPIGKYKVTVRIIKTGKAISEPHYIEIKNATPSAPVTIIPEIGEGEY